MSASSSTDLNEIQYDAYYLQYQTRKFHSISNPKNLFSHDLTITHRDCKVCDCVDCLFKNAYSDFLLCCSI